MTKRYSWFAVGGAVIALAIGWWLWHRGGDDAPGAGSAMAKPVLVQKLQDRAQASDERMPLAVLVDDDPRGALRLEGQVVDDKDKPVAGATVTLASTPPRTATTEQDGSFAFDALVARPYTLVARAKQGIAGPVTARLTAKSDPIVLHLRPAAKVTVAVGGTDGKSIDGATVELRGIDDQRETTRGGTATFPVVVPGGYQVVAWASGMAKSFQWVQVGAGETAVKLTLVPGAAVAGRVVDEHGTGVAGAHVVFAGASDWSAQGDERLDAVTTAADGAWKIAAMPAGSFRFTASHADHAPGTSPLVTLDGRTERTGVTITLADGATVRGRVVDGAKRPVASARVRIGAATRAMLFTPPRQAYSDANGEFVIKGLAKRELVAVAMHETGASGNVAVDTTRGDVGGVTLVLDVTGTIAGIVVDPRGAPVENVQVSAGPNFRDSRATGDFTQWRLRGFPQELTDASGRFKLTGLAPGSYLVSAAPAHAASRGRRNFGDGVVAQTGQSDLKLVLAPEGAIKGKIAFADGSAPAMFTVSVGFIQQAFTGDGSFTLDALAPQTYELNVRGPSFQPRAVEVVVDSGKTADVGTITVAAGRGVGGVVVAAGQPVAGATVYAGRMIFGTGTSNAASSQFNPMARGTKDTTTGSDGTFALTGFSDGDLTIVAEHPDIGRSKALRLPTDMPGQTDLVLELQKFGALSGVLRQAGKPIEGVFVSCQSTTSPGALYTVASGPDGAYRFDKLAPDTYKVSATVGMPMLGMHMYSKQIDVPSGQEVTIDLTVEPGTVTLEVVAAATNGKVGVATAWLASGAIVAHTMTELSLKLAAAGAGASQLVIVRQGEPAVFKQVAPGAYTVCVVPYPAEVQGMAAMGYAERHGDKLAAFCKPATVTAVPDAQKADVIVQLPAFVPDPPPGGGSGSAH